ncbi:MAG: outer membrane protein assembly factor BamD [Fibrobacterota bacterium]
MKRVLTYLLLAVLISAGNVSARGDDDSLTKCQKRYKKAMKEYNEEDYNRAILLFDEILQNCVEDIDHRDSLYFRIGETHMALEEYKQASIEYREILARFPKSELRGRSMFRLAQALYLDAPIYQRDISVLRQAQRRFNMFINEYPQSNYADSARLYLDTIYSKFVTKAMENAEFYSIIDKYDAAVIYYEDILENFPKTTRKDSVYYCLAKNLIRAERYIEAETYMDRLRKDETWAEKLRELENLMEKVKNRGD